MLALFITLYLVPAIFVGWCVWSDFRGRRYVTLKEALIALVLILCPGVNFYLACWSLWEATEDFVIWSRK